MKFRGICLAFSALTYGVAHAAVPGVITYAVIGAADPNKKVTALDAVSGAGVSNLSVPMPVYILHHGYKYTVTIGMQNYGFAGTCVTSYALGSGATGATNIANYSTANYSCPASSIWTFPFPVPAIPNTPGAALLTATVKYGTTSVVTKIPLIIE